MSDKPVDPSDLVMTQAELAPAPGAESPRPRTLPLPEGGAGGFDRQALADVRELADRLGGLPRLREAVELLLRQQS